MPKVPFGTSQDGKSAIIDELSRFQPVKSQEIDEFSGFPGFLRNPQIHVATYAKMPKVRKSTISQESRDPPDLQISGSARSPDLQICQISRSPDLPDLQICHISRNATFPEIPDFPEIPQIRKMPLFRKSRNSGNPGFPEFPDLPNPRSQICQVCHASGKAASSGILPCHSMSHMPHTCHTYATVCHTYATQMSLATST